MPYALIFEKKSLLRFKNEQTNEKRPKLNKEN